MNDFYREKIALHVQLNLDFLKSMSTYNALVLFQKDEIMKLHQERENSHNINVEDSSNVNIIKNSNINIEKK